MAHRAFILLAALGGLLLSGCAADRFTAEVTQFHDLAGGAKGRSFMVMPVEDSRASSLEFRSYARMIVGELVARGLRQAEALERSDMIVFVDYGVDSGRLESYPVPVYGYYPDRFTQLHGVRKSGKRFSAHAYESGGLVPLGISEITETVFTRSLAVDIVDAPPWRRGQTVKRYEARATSIGRESNLSAVMPLMIRALFQDFPGEDGGTRTVVLNPQSE